MTETEWFTSDWPDDLLEYVCSLRRTALGITSSVEEESPDFRPRVYVRKRRLFIAACCRRIWRLLPNVAREAVNVAERFADGEASEAQRIAAVAQVETAGKAYWNGSKESDPSWLAGEDGLKAAGGAILPFTDVSYSRTSLWIGPGDRPFLDGDHYDGGFGWTTCYAVNALTVAEENPSITQLLGVRWKFLHPRLVAEEGLPVAGTRWHAELVGQCHLVRDMFGNPFRPLKVDDRWLSPTAFTVAESIYSDHAFDRLPILADALEDAGCDNQDILKHCRQQPADHVRGCWVVDLVLGKE